MHSSKSTMHSSKSAPSRVGHLAKRLEEDIRDRALRAGDRYLTATEAGELLGVSTTTAHRALKLLADRDMLTRHQKRGAFVALQPHMPTQTSLRTVYILSAPEVASSYIRSDVIMNGIRSHVGNAINIQFSFLGENESIRYVRELLDSAKVGSEVAGIVSISGPREVYRILARANVPCMVVGSLYVGDPPISSIDSDHGEAGRLLAEYLVGRGHRRIAVFTLSEGRPGDYTFFDGVTKALTAAKLPPDAMLVRHAPRDLKGCLAAARHTLEAADRPTAFIVRHHHLVDRVVQAASDLGLAVPRDVEVVFEDMPATQVKRPSCTHTYPTMGLDEISGLIGRMLRQFGDGEPLERRKIVIPVRLREVREAGVSTNESA